MDEARGSLALVQRVTGLVNPSFLPAIVAIVVVVQVVGDAVARRVDHR